MINSNFQLDKLTFDVGGMGIKSILFDQNEKIILEKHIYYPNYEKGQKVKLKTILELINNEIKAHQNKIDLGICIPGILDSKKFEILTESFLVDIKNINIFNELTKNNKNINKLLIENDAKSAALGELDYGYSSIYKDCIFITIGSGVGGAVIIDGKIVNGSNGLAGEISKIYSNLENTDERVLAHVGSTMALQYEYSISSKTNINDINGKLIMEKFKNNDIFAVDAVLKITNALARSILNMSVILNPEVIIVGGGISENKDFIEKLINKTSEYFINQKIDNFMPKIIPCKLGNKAGCYGMLSKLNKEKTNV